MTCQVEGVHTQYQGDVPREMTKEVGMEIAEMEVVGGGNIRMEGVERMTE